MTAPADGPQAQSTIENHTLRDQLNACEAGQ